MKRLLPVLLLFIAGCAATHPIHPGSPNRFDSDTYDTLLVTHNVIESTKADLAAGKFPVSITDKVKTALNVLVDAYNAADTGYQAYHAAALSGTATPTDQTALQVKVNTMTSAVTSLSSAKGGQ